MTTFTIHTPFSLGIHTYTKREYKHFSRLEARHWPF